MLKPQQAEIWVEQLGDHEIWCIDFKKWNIGAIGYSESEAVCNLFLNTRRYMQQNLDRNRHHTAGFGNLRTRGSLWETEGVLRGPSPRAIVKVPPQPITILKNKGTRIHFEPVYQTWFQKLLRKFRLRK